MDWSVVASAAHAFVSPPGHSLIQHISLPQKAEIQLTSGCGYPAICGHSNLLGWCTFSMFPALGRLCSFLTMATLVPSGWCPCISRNPEEDAEAQMYENNAREAELFETQPSTAPGMEAGPDPKYRDKSMINCAHHDFIPHYSRI